MFAYIIQSSVFTKAIFISCILGFISWLVLAIAYRSMIKASSQIGKTKKKWLVSLKKKYEDYHQMNVKVNNVSTFVDRLFRRKKILGFSCSFWQTLLRLCIAACAVIGAAGALAFSQGGAELNMVMIHYMVGITGACGLIFLDVLLRGDEKRRAVLCNMNDYLENVLENTMAGREAVEDAGERKEHRRRLFRYAQDNSRKRKRKWAEEPVSWEEEQLLEDVLQEFFA